jgi:predicted secreted protein
LRQSEEGDLIARAINTYKAKANTASKALGYSSWTIRQISVGPVSSGGGPRPMFAARASSGLSSAATPMALEAGRVTLEVSVTGSVQMRR